MLNKEREIQGVRGIATLMVFLSHALGIIPFELKILGYDLNNSPLRIFFGGDAAIIIFFVLSGYFSYYSIKGFNFTIYKKYILKRIIRLYPLYILILFLGMILCNINMSYPKQEFSTWFGEFWNTRITIKEFFKECTMILDFNANLINPPIWTLKYEIRMAFILPIIIPLLKKYNSALVYIFVILVSIFINRISFLYVFILGAILNKHKENIIVYLYSRVQITTILIGVLGFIMMGFKYNFKNVANILPATVNYLIIGCGVCILLSIIFILKSKNREIKLLNNNFLIFYGDISYSFYLLHFIVLLSLRPLVLVINNYLLYIMISFIVTTILAYYSKLIARS